jgi:hypothetical protein
LSGFGFELAWQFDCQAALGVKILLDGEIVGDERHAAANRKRTKKCPIAGACLLTTSQIHLALFGSPGIHAGAGITPEGYQSTLGGW